jgi:HSP20 family protein
MLIEGSGTATAILAVGGLCDLWVTRMGTQLDRWLASSLRKAADAYQETCWRPSADIYQTADGWLVKFDLAGVQPSEIELAVCGRALSLSGVRRDCTISECRHAYSMEINYSRFSRTIELPNDLNEARISTEYRDGMLLVRLITERGTS